MGGEEVSGHATRRLASNAPASGTVVAQPPTRPDPLRILLGRLPHGVLVVDAELNVEYANDSVRTLMRPARVRIGRPLPEPWPDFSLTAFVRSLLDGTLPFAEREVSVEERSFSLVGVSAQPARTALLLIEDMTARERRVRAERDFLANVAHELRTPLAVIAGAIEVLQSGAKDEPEDRDRFLGHIERQNVRITGLIQSLLVLARTQAGVEAPRLDVVEVGPLLREIERGLRAASEVELVVRCDPGVTVVADRELAYRALANLADNAAANTTSGTITLAARELDSAVEITISDTGPGMSDEAQQRAFDRFYRAGRRDRQGFGLGLSIADEAVRVLGGRIELESELNVGTTVRVELPSRRDEP